MSLLRNNKLTPSYTITESDLIIQTSRTNGNSHIKIIQTSRTNSNSHIKIIQTSRTKGNIHIKNNSFNSVLNIFVFIQKHS